MFLPTNATISTNGTCEQRGLFKRKVEYGMLKARETREQQVTNEFLRVDERTTTM